MGGQNSRVIHKIREPERGHNLMSNSANFPNQNMAMGEGNTAPLLTIGIDSLKCQLFKDAKLVKHGTILTPIKVMFRFVKFI